MYKYIIVIAALILCSDLQAAQCTDTSGYDWNGNVVVDLSEIGAATITLCDGEVAEKADTVEYQCIHDTCDELGTAYGQEVNGSGSSITIYGAGLYHVDFLKNGESEWSQQVYIPAFAPSGVAEKLAKQYIPVAVYHADEEYFPLSLETILSYDAETTDYVDTLQVEDGSFWGGRFSLATSLTMGDEIKSFLTQNGNESFFFDFATYTSTCVAAVQECVPHFMRSLTGQGMDPVVYWDVSWESEHGYWSSAQDTDYLHLTYWYFYAFDPKTGSQNNPAIGAHVFDRESVTIRFRYNEITDQFTPFDVTYAGHLAKQTIYFTGCDNHSTCVDKDGSGQDLIEWNGGKTTISWDNIVKTGKHPVLYKAKGAHAVYPTYGYYSVHTPNLGRLLDEPAGSVVNPQVITPDSFQLLKLDYSAMGYLAYSGAWVDVLATDLAKFPPFTRLPYSSWLGEVNTEFDDCFGSSDCEAAAYFDVIRGLGDLRAYTYEVVGSDGEPVSAALLRLTASDGSLEKDFTALDDGIVTLFLTPDIGVTYTISTVNDYGEFPCHSFTFTSLNEPQANGEANQICEAGEAPQGSIQGSISDAVTDTAVSGATIAAYHNITGDLAETVNSDSSGQYFMELTVGSYTLGIEADGYISAQLQIQVSEGETVTATELQQVSEQYAGLGVASGVITDAISGSAVSGVSLIIRSGINTHTGEQVSASTTASDGSYEISLEAGNYTVEASANGYISSYFNIVAIGEYESADQNAAITPVLDNEEIRIVLSWGRLPYDLDSHLWIRSSDGSIQHVYYDNTGSEHSAPYAQLDVDDRYSYGPETITVYQRMAGTYYYSVHNYSESPSILDSEAKVEVYDASGLIATFNIPINGSGTLWNVFSIDGDTGQIQRIDEISNSAPL